jgi:hypothetical protein
VPVLGGVVLIAAGIGLFATANSFLSVANDYNKLRAEQIRNGRLPRAFTAVADANARWGGRVSAWGGRLVGVVAIVGGVVLLARG